MLKLMFLLMPLQAQQAQWDPSISRRFWIPSKNLTLSKVPLAQPQQAEKVLQQQLPSSPQATTLYLVELIFLLSLSSLSLLALKFHSLK